GEGQREGGSYAAGESADQRSDDREFLPVEEVEGELRQLDDHKVGGLTHHQVEDRLDVQQLELDRGLALDRRRELRGGRSDRPVERRNHVGDVRRQLNVAEVRQLSNVADTAAEQAGEVDFMVDPRDLLEVRRAGRCGRVGAPLRRILEQHHVAEVETDLSFAGGFLDQPRQVVELIHEIEQGDD